MENKNILIVEDEAITAMVLKKHLTNEGYRVTSTESPIKGIEILKNEFYSLVITDLNMPEMGGIAFLRWVNQNSPKTDVILMTSHSTKELKDAAKQRGAVDFLDKPIDLKKLATFIKSKYSGNKKFAGSIKEISLPEFIKMFLISGRKRRISITDNQTNEVGLVYIHEGKIVQAEFKDLKGEEAFYSIMTINNGSFSDLEWQLPEKFAISQSSDYLLREATRIREAKKVTVSPDNIEVIKIKHDKKILVIDDDRLTALIIHKYLSQHGYTVEVGYSAIEGEEILTKTSYDLVITDINMPEISGIDFLMWIKKFCPRTKVIVMTAFSSEAIRKYVNQNGALSYLEKPLNLKELDGFITSKLIDSTFSGYVRDIALLDYIKVMTFSNQTKLLSIIDPITSNSGTIYIKAGHIIHSEYGEIKGEEAFYSILKMESGIFTDITWTEPKEYSIQIPLENLLIEAEIVSAEENINKKLRRNEEKGLAIKNTLEDLLGKNYGNVSVSNIDDEKLGAYGIYIGNSSKERVIEVMKEYSSINVKSQKENMMLSYDDLSIMILFDDNDIVEEINFGELYKGSTYSGIAIGDTIQKAIEVYGKPRTATIKGAVWKNIAFFSHQGMAISSIRLRKQNFFDNTTVQMKLSSSEKKLIEAKGEVIPPVLGLDLTIYEEGHTMSIYLNKTDRDEIQGIMSSYSHGGFNDLRSTNSKFIYDDISLTIFFNSKSFVSEMNFGERYKGKTSKGLAIGDTLDRAVEIYGEPKFRNFSNAIWDKISVFSEDSNTIDSIRLQSEEE